MRVGIDNPFTKVNPSEYYDYGVPGQHPVGVGYFGSEVDYCGSKFVGPLSPSQQAECAHRSKPMKFSGNTEILTQLSEHLNQSSFGVPNWFLYAGAGLGAWFLFGGRR